MAKNINIDPSISLSIKPPATMTLPELVNMARGVEAYQREREVFPELIEQAKLETQRQRGLLPEQLEQARIQTGAARTSQQKGVFELSKNQSDELMRIVGGFRNDPRVASGNPDQALSALDEIKIKAVNAGIPRSKVEELGSTAARIALQNPRALPQYFDNVIQIQAGAASQLGLQTPEIIEAGGQQGIFRRGSGRMETLPMPGSAPRQEPTAAPIAPRPQSFTEDGVLVTPIPPYPVKQREVIESQLRGEPRATSERLPLTYPVREAGVPYAALPQEQSDLAAGNKFRDQLVQRQSELTTARRNLQEVIRTATKIEEGAILPETGPVGALKRAFANWVGDPTYKQLSKDIANVQIANIKAMGGSMDTVSGQNLAKMASGDETYPPKVLLDIARRADADITNLDMMATGLQRHSQKFGDANSKRFQQMWASNADSRLFEIMNIERDVKDPNKQKEMVNNLLSGIDESQAKELMRKRRNLMKLYKNGDL